jgi:DNA (cytosine-5)-methyltransferase 1
MGISQPSEAKIMDQSGFWSEEHLASLTASQDSEAEWMMRVATSPSNISAWLIASAPDGFCGRTSPGVFSSSEGRDFACFLGGLSGRDIRVPREGWQNSGIIEQAEGGYGLAWRTLDAQFAGLAQRRERVFVVGYFGDWRPAAAVLFERHGLSWNPPPRRGARQGVAGSIGQRINRSRTELDGHGAYIPEVLGKIDCTESGISGTVTNKWHKGSGGPAGDEHYNLITHSLRGDGFDASEDGSGRGTPLVPVGLDQEFNASEDQLGTLKVGGNGGFIPPSVAIPIHDKATRHLGHSQDRAEADGNGNGLGVGEPGDPMFTMTSGDKHAIAFAADDYANHTFEETDLARPLTNSPDRSRAAPIIAFSAKDHGADAGLRLQSNSSRRRSHEGSHANAGVMPAIAFKVRTEGSYNGAKGGKVKSGHGGAGILYDDEKTFTVASTQDQRGEVLVKDVVDSLKVGGGKPGQGYPAVAVGSFKPNQGSGARSLGYSENVSPTLESAEGGNNKPALLHGMAVRRLTPRECERLQGFPDDYTLIPNWKKRAIKQEKLDHDYLKYLARGGKLTFEECMRAADDGPRYKALGNSWAVPVVRWIGKRLLEVDSPRGGSPVNVSIKLSKQKENVWHHRASVAVTIEADGDPEIVRELLLECASDIEKSQAFARTIAK